MPAPVKHRHSSGYRREQTEQVESACLTLGVKLGALMDRLCIVGGLVPTLLVDRQLESSRAADDLHPGTNDLDVGLAVVLLDDRQYTEISARLRREDFQPDENDSGNRTPQRWKHRHLDVTVDFLLPPIPGAERGGRVHSLEGDFGALISPGLQLAFDERHEVTMEGYALSGERVRRTVPVCGPATFVVLKSLALADRGEHKDAYDLVYVLGRWAAGIDDIAVRLTDHAARHPEVVRRALRSLANDFADTESLGPRRAASFLVADRGDLDAAAADAHGHVDDLLRACRALGLDAEAL